jgi:acetyl esterase/lipase
MRLIYGIFLFALSLLAVFAAPTFVLWQIAVLVTEFGYLLALAALGTLLPGWRRTRQGQIGAALGLGALMLMFTPLLRALPVAQALPAQLTRTFGPVTPRSIANAPTRPAPLVLADLVRGLRWPTLTPQRLTYLERDGTALQLDLYRSPAADGRAPGVIVIHGGSWQGGDSSQLAPLNSYLAARGYVVAAINYRLSPQHQWPAARDDVRAAIDFLKANAAEFGLDPQRLVLLGRSAGGQLALVTAYASDDPAIRGVVSFYAPTDLSYGYANPANPLVIDSRGTLEAYLGGPPPTMADAYAAASAAALVDANTPPTLIFHGDRDELVRVRNAEILSERLAAAGRPHLFVRLPWATHGFDFNFSGPAGQISTYAIEHFLAAVTR